MKTAWTVDGEDMVFHGPDCVRLYLPKKQVDHPRSISLLLSLWQDLTANEQDELLKAFQRLKDERKNLR